MKGSCLCGAIAYEVSQLDSPIEHCSCGRAGSVIQADGSHLAKIWKRVQRLDPHPSPALCHREAVDNLRAGERYHEAYQAVFTQDFPALFAQVQCPILMLCGEHDVLMPYFQPACAARPDAKSLVLPGGTYVVDDYPDEVAAAVHSFLSAMTV